MKGNRLSIYSSVIFLTILILATACATTTLPNEEPILCVYYGGNVTSSNTFQLSDMARLNKIKLDGFTCFSQDLRADLIWRQWEYVDWSAVNAEVAYAKSIGLYVDFQPEWWDNYSTAKYPAWLDDYISLTKVRYMDNFPSQSPHFTDRPTQPSFFDPNYEIVEAQWHGLIKERFKDEPIVSTTQLNPNEGFYRGLMDYSDAAVDYWQKTCLPSYYADNAALDAAYGANYSAFSDVALPTDFSNSKKAADWFTCKSDKATETYLEGEKNLSGYGKIIFGQKVTSEYLVDTEAGKHYNYQFGVDLNKWWGLSGFV